MWYSSEESVEFIFVELLFWGCSFGVSGAIQMTRRGLDLFL